MKHKPTIFVDDSESGATKIQNFTKLALLLCNLHLLVDQRRDVIGLSHALAAYEADMAAAVGHLDV